MGAWQPTEQVADGGTFQLILHKSPYLSAVDVSRVRGVATQFDSYTSGDPFGDSTAQFTFPALTAFDDLNDSSIGKWLGYYANVDLWWKPAVAIAPQYAAETPVINPLTGKPDIVAPAALRASNGTITGYNKLKVWEGFLTAIDWTADESGSGLQITCQGAMFQMDRYLAKPFYPPQPWPLEMLIADVFNRPDRPPLRIRKLQTHFPVGWGLKVPKYTGSTASSYASVAKPGSLWTGYSSRQTGAWEHALTGFVQDQLTVMLTDKRCGLTTGNQWTVQHQHQSDHSPGRIPILTVRDRYRTPDFTVWLGTPGVSVHLTGDTTQSENVVFGDGTGVDGTVWRNAVISNDGTRTDYLPMAVDHTVYPARDNPQFDRAAFRSEAYTRFGTGFDQVDAVSVAEQSLERDRLPGYTGTITLKVDPSLTLPRWLVRAGMTVLLKGFAGAGERGVPLHITQTNASPMQGTVELTVDSRYRDLLTVEEAQARTRDPLTPVKMLQVGKSSALIEDLQAPWDYHAGSGFIPTDSRHFFANKPRNELYPYVSFTESHPPHTYGHWYQQCNANSRDSKKRWAGPIKVLVSEHDTIIRTEIRAVDYYGRPVKVPFHVSFYYNNTVQAQAMPHLHGYSAFQNNAFEKVDPATGVTTNSFLWPDDSFIVGWGNVVDGVANRAGFWPGREDAGAKATGLMVDDSQWQYDLSTRKEYYQASNPPGSRPASSDLTIYAMIYAEYHQPVWFQGRLFRLNPGATTP